MTFQNTTRSEETGRNEILLKYKIKKNIQGHSRTNGWIFLRMQDNSGQSVTLFKIKEIQRHSGIMVIMLLESTKYRTKTPKPFLELFRNFNRRAHRCKWVRLLRRNMQHFFNIFLTTLRYLLIWIVTDFASDMKQI